jgi:hypothetical protein
MSGPCPDSGYVGFDRNTLLLGQKLPAKVAPGWTKPFERMSSKAARDVITRAIRTN